VGVDDLVTVHNQPVANETKVVPIPPSIAVGAEKLGICLGRSCRRQGQVDAQATSMDDFLMRGSPMHVYQVTIDTEGWDALVLEGMRSSLRAKLVQIVEFEYSGFGFWGLRRSAGGRTLEGTLNWMSDLGYFCFVQGRTGLVPASPPCWRASFEMRRWTNLVCAQRGSALFGEMLKLSI
jgi:hypothetical protein